MASLRFDRIAALTGGTLVEGDAARRVGDFSLDSRTIASGGLFFAVVARRDGHDFVAEGAQRGFQHETGDRIVVGDEHFHDVPPCRWSERAWSRRFQVSATMATRAGIWSQSPAVAAFSRALMAACICLPPMLAQLPANACA